MPNRTIHRPPLPPQLPQSIYLVGIAGTGMGALAAVLADHGCSVSGSDKAAWEPMGSMLKRLGAKVLSPYDADNIPPNCALAVVGNAVSRTHPEVKRIEEHSIPWCSFPELVERYIAPGRPLLVAAGTHGKTSTSAILAHLLQETGHNPGYLIGGQPEGLPYPGAWGDPHAPFVIEGDEYSSCWHDHGPKFWHYPAAGVVLPSLEYDHADLYKNGKDYLNAFLEWDKILDFQTPVYAPAFWPMVRKWKNYGQRPFYLLGGRRKDDIRIINPVWKETEWHFSFCLHGVERGPFRLPMAGKHNLENTVLALSLLLDRGQEVEELRIALATFGGIRKRQTVLHDHDGRTVLFDFGHHPTEIEATLQAVRQQWPEGELTAIFEPRSFSSRTKIHQEGYQRSFATADRLLLAPVFAAEKIPENDRLDTERVAASHTHGKACLSYDELATQLDPRRRGVWCFFSNGAFEDLPAWFADQCKKEELL